MEKHVIWSDLNFDYERDWEDAMMEMYPDASDLERRAIAMQENADNLEYAREDLNIDLGTPILVLAVLDLWDGKRYATKLIESGNIRECLRYYYDYGEFLLNEDGDLACYDAHHDGTNYYVFRAVRKGKSARALELLGQHWRDGNATREEINRVTYSLGKRIARVYGWKVSA